MCMFWRRCCRRLRWREPSAIGNGFWRFATALSGRGIFSTTEFARKQRRAKNGDTSASIRCGRGCARRQGIGRGGRDSIRRPASDYRGHGERFDWGADGCEKAGGIIRGRGRPPGGPPMGMTGMECQKETSSRFFEAANGPPGGRALPPPGKRGRLGGASRPRGADVLAGKGLQEKTA